MSNAAVRNFFLPALSVLILVSCRKSKSEQRKLPAATHQGRGTFGCLVNGRAFTPKGAPFAGPVSRCAYQFVDGGYYLQLMARRDEAAGDQPLVRSISLGTDSFAIEEGKTYKLQSPRKGSVIGQHNYFTIPYMFTYLTTDSLPGELTISRFDTVNQIISGTFWFQGSRQEMSRDTWQV